MAVVIDQIDSELEIVPAGDRPAAAAATPAAVAAAPPGSRESVRRAVVRALEDELDDYLRSRG